MTARKKSTAVAKVQPEDMSVLAIIGRAASDPAVDVDKMNGLWQMQERIMAQQAKKEFNASLSAMQAELPVINERGNANNRYTYAKWEDINKAITPFLSKNGFSLSFKTSTGNGEVTVITVLRHIGGHEETSSMTLPYDSSGNKNAVQSAGSSLSYCCRYGAKALINYQTTLDQDDDGAAGSVKAISKEDFALLDARLDKDGVDKAAFCRRYRIDAISQLPTNKLALAFTELDARKESLEKKGEQDV